jgi:beta-glucosidase
MPDGPSVLLPSDGKEAIDRKTLTLEQEQLAKAVLAANPKTIVVLQASFPFTTTWTQEHVPAILEMTHNSEEQGDGLADVLFGDYNPAGRLTQTWVASMDQLPPMMDYDIRHGRTYMYLTVASRCMRSASASATRRSPTQTCA